jgi:putative heme iron utilization protein
MTATTTTPAPAANAHETAGPPVVGDLDSFPSYAELSRTLIEPGGIATLSTLTPSGYPYASIAPYSALTNGAPLICVSSLAEHTQNLRLDPRASVLIKAPSNPGLDPLSQARVTVLGAFIPADPSNAEIEAHLELHPFARHYVGFADFSWWRLDASELRYVGGFGAMGWATGQAYSEAVPDPVLPHAAPMIEHLNADHAEACLSIVRHLTGVPEARRAPVSSIDRYGMTIDAYGAGDDYLAIARTAFPAPLASADEVRGASVELVRKASAATPG